MRKHAYLLELAVFSCVSLMTVSMRATTHEQGAGNRIFVVAVHDSSLFTLCNPSLRDTLANVEWKDLPPPTSPLLSGPKNRFYFQRYEHEVHWDGRVSTVIYDRFPFTGVKAPPPIFPQDPGVLERDRPDWLELSRMVPGVCPSGWVDPETSREIEAEFKKKNDYLLVDSAEKADLVFLVESSYFTYWLQGGKIRLYNSLYDDSGFGRHLRQAAIAVAIPAEIYRQHSADSEALLAAQLWAGVSLHKAGNPEYGISRSDGIIDTEHLETPASPKNLVGDFLNKKKWPDNSPPLYAAWAGAPRPVADAMGVRPVDETKPAVPMGDPEITSPDNAIRVGTNLVTVPVFASDGVGKYVPGLTVENFHVYEDGVEQEIDRFFPESAPLQAALIMDISYSTGFVRPEIEAAGLAFAGVLSPAVEVMVLSFTNRIFVESELTGDRDRLRRAITQSRERGGTRYSGKDRDRIRFDRTRYLGTRLYDVVDLAVTERFDKLSGRKAILLFTDGVDTGSRLATYESSLARIEESDVLVYVVHYETAVPKVENPTGRAGMIAAYARGAEYLRQLADLSGGRLFKASAETGFQEILSIVAEEMSHQYMLCYYPKSPIKDSSFRSIQVTVDQPGIKLRARTGYRPSSKSPAANR
jgi:VWFA-related protein